MSRCASYCCGESYNMNKVHDHFHALGYNIPMREKECICIHIPTEKNHFELFVFQYGVAVFWGTDQQKESSTIKILSNYLNDPLKEPITETCKYRTRKSGEIEVDESQDTIILNSDDTKVKFAFSYGFSQSSKLTAFEDWVDNTIAITKDITTQLMQDGKTHLSRSQVAKKVGKLFAVRNYINLHSDILDTPEFFWRQPKYEPYYEMSSHFWDLEMRMDILNNRLNVIKDLYDLLTSELQHAHSSRLEWIIIILIAIEVLITLFIEFWVN
jgi:uncharacterized Rmd1/YagE family protein